MHKYFYNAIDPNDDFVTRLYYIFIGFASIVDGLVNIITLGCFGTNFTFHFTVAMATRRLQRQMKT